MKDINFTKNIEIKIDQEQIMAHQTVQIKLSIAESTDCVNGENDCFHIKENKMNNYYNKRSNEILNLDTVVTNIMFIVFISICAHNL